MSKWANSERREPRGEFTLYSIRILYDNMIQTVDKPEPISAPKQARVRTLWPVTLFEPHVTEQQDHSAHSSHPAEIYT